MAELVETLPDILIASLIPNSALFGILLAFHRRRKPTSLRVGMFWLVLTFGIGGLTLWASGVTLFPGSPIIEPLTIPGFCAFVFIYPHATFYWMRFHAASPPGPANLAKILGVSLLVLVGVPWFFLVVVLSINAAVTVSHLF